MQHELLHLWKTFLACWFFWEKTLPCLRFVPLLFWECMPYVICSVPCMIRCNRGILHVLPTMLYSLAYCGLLLLSLVGLAVCGWFRLIFPAVVICPTTVGGSIYLLCIFLLWNGFWMSVCLSLHCLPCDYLGEPPGTGCLWLSLPFKKLSMIHCPWSGILGWLHEYLSL